jgi:hypothetical protein
LPEKRIYERISRAIFRGEIEAVKNSEFTHCLMPALMTEKNILLPENNLCPSKKY